MTNRRWFEGDACEQTLGLLEDLGLSFVCRDGPGPGKPIVAATSEVGFVRFTGSPGREPEAPPQGGEQATDRGGVGVPAPGRSLGLGSQAGEQATDRGGVGVPAPGRSLGLGPQAGEQAWSYRYSDAELAAWAPPIRELASCTSEVHLIMDNCWRANAVDNASSLLDLVAT